MPACVKPASLVMAYGTEADLAKIMEKDASRGNVHTQIDLETAKR
jgi:hypothetical protein